VGALLLYDADCGFCRWSAATVLRLDRRALLRPVALQEPEADGLLEGLTTDERMRSWHLVEESGRRYSAGAAFAPLLRLLPRGERLAALADRFPRTVEVGYEAVASRRSWLSRLVPATAKARAGTTLARRAASS
jgi:predicted DCC family thiol-disulfide oxidoreductase YuxK